MLKALMPVAGVRRRLPPQDRDLQRGHPQQALIVVTIGVAIASYGRDQLFIVMGVVLQLLSVACESTRLTLRPRSCCSAAGLKLNPVTTVRPPPPPPPHTHTHTHELQLQLQLFGVEIWPLSGSCSAISQRAYHGHTHAHAHPPQHTCAPARSLRICCSIAASIPILPSWLCGWFLSDCHSI